MTFRKRMLRHGPRTGVLAASIGALIATGGISSTALGQDEEEEEAAAADDAIVVTGTRIRRNDYTATNATVTVTAEDMRNLGVTSVAEMVSQLPSNVADITPETGTDSTFNMGANIANLRGLNPNGGSRTLVLVDSRRVLGSNSAGFVDMNMIPTALVGRVETVTGGASATYGADAMAGVVNVILDTNLDVTRVDLSYSTTQDGDGDDVNLSIASGFEVFDRRGSIQVGYDRQNQDGIGDCTLTREICRTSFGIYQNGSVAGPLFAPPPPPYTNRNTNIIYPGLPHYVISEGFRYARPTEGYFVNSQPHNPANLAQGIYTFTDDGRDVVPMYGELTQAQRSAMVAAGEGPNAMTPFGQGALAYSGVPVIPEQTRDNLFTRFAYDFEGGIELETSISYGKTESISQQNSARQSWYGARTFFARNAFLQPQWGTTQAMRDVFNARLTGTAGNLPPPGFPQGNLPSMTTGFTQCLVAPFIGNPSTDTTTYDYPLERCNTQINKDVSPFVARFNTTDTDQWTWTVGANGDLFEGGSWTWDAALTYGESERFVEVQGWQSTRRLEMSENSEWDATANGGLGAPVCAIDSNMPYDPASPTADPLYASVYQAGDTRGDYWTWKWLEYIQRSVENNQQSDDPQVIFDTLAGRNGAGAPCAPFNPYGNQMYPGSIAYAFPSIIDGSLNTQTNMSLSFSGDAWRGFGDAGPVRMAAGVDFRYTETDNGAGQNNILDRDFGLNFSDDWNGETETNEAFVELEVPLLRNKPGVDYLMANVAYRFTDNTTRRVAGAGNFNPNTEDQRSIESWKASMVWRPVDLMTVRMTRSTDTRAPSGVELFETNRPATSATSSFSSPFRPNLASTPENDSNEEVISFSGAGNPFLEEEVSITQTVGFVFTPTEVLSGLNISIDYYETDIEGGITNVGTTTVATRCRDELALNGYDLESAANCSNIVFGTPIAGDDDKFLTDGSGVVNPLYPFVNILEISSSSENTMPFLSRGLDMSVSYSTQLGGGGFLSARVLASRALEQRVTQTGGVSAGGLGPTFDVSGQTGSQGIGSIWSWAANIFTNYAPTPRISGNAFLTYSKNAFTTTSQVRYVGSGALTRQTLWLGPGDCGAWYQGGGTIQNYTCYDPAVSPNMGQTVTSNQLPSWTTLNLTFEYDFASSRFSFDRFESLSVYMDIDNATDKMPDRFTGNGTGAQNTTFFSIMGRTYRVGARMSF
jgi:outer membrane receptor protein involved in Fe transport